MLYEKYEKKVRLFLQLKNLIIKFKVLIISVTIAVASFTTLFIATKGIVYNISIPEIIYGDDAYDIKVQSLFSNYTIYYREKDTLEWHQQKPLLAGSYELKVTTNGSFGEKIQIYPFEIQPKALDVSLVETAIQFGTDIRINASLAYSDYIESFRFEFKDLSKNQTTVLVNEIVIHNSNGENVTNNYKFVPFEKQISFIPRKVSVTLLDAQFEYDGNHHYSSTFIINEGSLIEGHTIIVEGKGRIQNVGSIDNDFLSIHIYDGEIDVTSNYDIEKIIGQIEVYKRKITIETLSQSKVYDGTPLSYDHFEIKEGTLVLGHQFIPVFSKSEDVIGIVKNKLESYQILDENGLDVTTNYDIEIIEGTLEILKRAIKVKTSSLDKIYDATPLTSETFEIIEGSLVNDHEFIIQGYSAIIHVGTLQNQLTLKILNDEIDVTAYYDISFEYGTLTVHPRPIRIESESSNKIYDGTPLSYGVFNLVEGSILNHEMILKDKLEVTDVGTYENRIVVEIYKDSENITKNYDIQYTFGTLEIHPKPITIKPKDEIKTYDGKYLTSNIAEFLDNSTILEHHQITIETNGSIKYVGIVQNHIEKVLITENEKDVTHNYEITYEVGYLEITKRLITIETHDSLKTYDGKYFSHQELSVIEGSIVDGETYVIIMYASVIDAGIYENIIEIEIFSDINVTENYEITYVYGKLIIEKRYIHIELVNQIWIYDDEYHDSNEIRFMNDTSLAQNEVIIIEADGRIKNVGTVQNHIINYSIFRDLEEVTENYIVEVDSGELSIHPRPITIESKTDQKIYDETSLYNIEVKDVFETLIEGHHIEVIDFTSMINVGSEENIIVVKIYDSFDIDVTENYVIDYQYGILEIFKRPITIESKSDEKVYDNEPLFNTTVYDILGMLIDGHKLEVIDYQVLIETGSIENVVTIVIKDVLDNDVTHNYDITYEYGTLTVHPRPITIKPKDVSKIYDGEYLTSNIVEIVEGSLLDHHFIEITTNGQIKYVGQVSNHIQSVVIKENGIDITHNYAITFTEGYLDVYKRPITIQTQSSSKIYDGKYFDYQEISIIEGTLVMGEKYTITAFSSVVNAGTYDNILEILIFNESFDVTNNYDITYIYGELVIHKRYIYISLVDAMWIYDDTYHYSNEIEFLNDTSLAPNQEIIIETEAKIKEVGTIENIIVSYMILNDFEDVTNNYIVDTKSGTLTINPRPITIQSESDEKVYDNEPLFNTTVYDMLGMLIDGHKLEVIDYQVLIEAGSIENVVTIVIKDVLDNDVTHNYDITYEYGTLTVHPRPITIQSKSDEKVYDNEPLFNTTVYDILGMLIDGHKLEVIDYQVLIEAGSIENVVTIVIKDVLDNDVTHNYDITYEYGTLTVHPRPITIKPKDVSKIYDGEYLTSNIVEIVEGSLLDNHFIEIVTNGYIKKAGRINNEIIDVYIYDNIKEVTKNYEITYVIGYLEVIPRDLYIQTSSSDKEYDGFELFSLEYYDINHQLVIGDFIIIDNYSKIKNVDVVENILDILIFDSNYDNVTESYHIIFEYGLLEIYPRYIKIKPIDIEKVYDDQILISNDYEIIEGSLAINETLMIETSGSIIEVGSIENEIIGFNMYNIENEETTLNYIVDIEIGYLKIIPRPIMVYSESETWIYNDEEFFNINISYELSQLVTGHQIRVIDYAKIIDVEVKQNELYVKISRENGDDVTHNYDISYSYGTLEVLPRPITVLSKSKDKIYDGYLLEYHEYEITFGSLVLGHELLPIFSSSITDVGEVNNDIEVSIYKGLRDVTLNYEITYDLGILKIYPRPITIETLSNSKTYDGEAILNPGYILKEGNLVLDHYFIIIEEPYMVDAGIQYNELVLDITNGERSYLSNYDITYIYGELIILPRPITIQTASDEKTYDDIEFYNLNHTIIEGSLVLDHLTIVDEFTVIKDAILTNNILRIKIVDSYSEDKTSNYDITYVYGLLEIYKRYVKIETASNHKIYDGLDLSDQNYTILDGSFVDSHTLIVLHSTKIKYVGSEFNYFDEIDILNANNESVLSNYLIEGAYGVLTIDPRPLSFIVSDKTFEYNGEPQTSKAYELIDDTSFGNDDILTFISTYITDVGTIENRIGDIKILNGEMDVTSNYLIDYVEGMLTVEPRYVRVRTNDDSKMFDGIPLTNHEFTIFEGSFVLDHELILAFDGIQAEIGISPNSAYEYYVLDGLGVDKTYNYIVDIEFGLLEVTRRVIEISTPSAEKVYDGLPLTAATYEITLGSVILEHQLIVHVIGSITEPGKMKNNYEFVILDTYGNDVSHYYIVQENLGTLKVIDPRIKITITSENASKPYDGTPLISEMWELTEGMLLDNHQLYVIMTGSQTEVGTSNNTFTYVILDENLEDIADIYYQVVLDFGTLYVYDENSSGGLPPGGISIDRTGTPSDDASLEKPLFKIFSEVSTMIYLRYASHGDYIPETGAFDEAIQYFGETVSPLAWPGYNLNQQSYLMKLETIVGGLSYMMPYYSVDGFNNRLSDVFIGKGFGKGYEINFIPYESDEILKQVPPMTHFSEEELVYREFVREHYLNIPEETKAQMLRIARQNGIKNTSPTLIEDIQLYILSAAIYNMDFDTIPDGVDAAVYFLEYLREGICQHFAMAATVMYRAFGIPARYVTGFVADAEKDEWVEVTAGKGHAWVEFYVDGFGWIPIEVTPGGAGGTNGSGRGSIPGRGSGNGAAIDGGEGGEGESGEGEGGAGIGGGGSGPIKPKITIQTSNDSKVYDGTPLENKNYYVSGDIKTGHEVIVNVTGTITQVGEKRNTFEYFIVDENGNDVASEYQIVKIPGTLVVVPVNDKEILEISLYNLTRVYNGKTFENKDGYWISSQNLPSGYKVELEILGSIKDVGIIETYVNYGSVRVYDEKGIDVTNRYNVVAYYGTIEVVKLSITLTTETKMKIYDGTPLTAHNAVVSKGKLINGDTLVLQYGGSQTIVGESKNNLVLIQIFDKNNQNVTNNYHITVIEGILTVIDTN